jgi:hypothetical protein
MMDKKDGEITELKQQVLFSTPEQYALLQDTVSALTQVRKLLKKICCLPYFIV